MRHWRRIARARGCLKRGEELDYVKASGLIFDDFRGGKIGRITLEWAGQQENKLMKKIGEIKEEFAAASEGQWADLLYSCTRRIREAAYRRLFLSIEKKLENLEKEKAPHGADDAV